MITDADLDAWNKPFRGRGPNFSAWDTNPSPVVGYRNMSHWTKDLTVLRYCVPWLVRKPDKIPKLLNTHIELMATSDPHRPLYLLFRLVKRLSQTGFSVEWIADFLYQTPNKTISHSMGRIMLREIERVRVAK